VPCGGHRLANDCVLADALAQGVVSSYGFSPDTIGLIADVLQRAKADGMIRADATFQDLTVLLGGCARQLARLASAIRPRGAGTAASS
jgi:hypothetical protein